MAHAKVEVWLPLSQVVSAGSGDGVLYVSQEADEGLPSRGSACCEVVGAEWPQDDQELPA